MTAVTARAYGLRVDSQVDEREDRVKSTVAAAKYLRDLILDFGTGSSVMLALAAYNSGAAAVKQAVVRNVSDPSNSAISGICIGGRRSRWRPGNMCRKYSPPS
jgi:soluble lytic murein transglycosylase-like protein